MRSTASLLALLLACPAYAETPKTGDVAPKIVAAQELAENPDDYIGKTIKVRHMRCADVPDGFACIAPVKAYFLRIEAQALGKLTNDTNSEKMASVCKGPVAFRNRRCEFDVVLTPKKNDSYGDRGVSIVRVVTVAVDML